ncbi:unnamed protein product [Echinostoma caproni]|uniref:Fibronectin type-III domain-containing protein n=1 Tax=Echinostoma caproni TaxID=27848 RepID=A0A183A413_9TREM|nr:unnamed protein product [Echinostoma caproni]
MIPYYDPGTDVKLIATNSANENDCSVRIYSAACPKTNTPIVVCPINAGAETEPYCEHYITTLFGSMHEVHYVRLNFAELKMNAFTARIEATMDGGAFINVKNVSQRDSIDLSWNVV